MRIVNGVVATKKQEQLILDAERDCRFNNGYSTTVGEVEFYEQERDEQIRMIMGYPRSLPHIPWYKRVFR